MRGTLGFTLMEVMVVIVIIGLLATIVLVNVAGMVDKARVETTKASIKEIEKAIGLFKNDMGKLPDSLDELLYPPTDVKSAPQGGYLESIPKDGWGREFVYEQRSGTRKGYVIISYGADGKPGGDGINADITNEVAEEKR